VSKAVGRSIREDKDRGQDSAGNKYGGREGGADQTGAGKYDADDNRQSHRQQRSRRRRKGRLLFHS